VCHHPNPAIPIELVSLYGKRKGESSAEQ
jgi:hypothetical protein